MLPAKELEYVNRQLKKFGFKKLADYYKSDRWKYARGIKRDTPILKCTLCDSFEDKKVQMDLHHTTYISLGEERGYDLMWLCHDCHEQLHEYVNDILSEEEGLLSFVYSYMAYENVNISCWMENEKLKKKVERLEEQLSNCKDVK